MDSRFLYALQGADLVSDDERKEVISLGTKAEQFDRLIEVMRVKGEPLDSFGRFLGVLQSDRNLKYLAKELQETRSREQSESDAIPHTADQISYPISETQPHDHPLVLCQPCIRPTNCHFYSTTSQPLATSWSQCAVNDDVICVVSRHCASRQEAFCRALLGRKKAADVASELTRATRRSSDKLDDILESWMDKDGTHKLVDIKKCCERRDVAVWGIVKTRLSELHKGIPEDEWLAMNVTREAIDILKLHASHKWVEIGCALLQLTIAQLHNELGVSNVSSSVHVKYALQEWMKQEEQPTVDKILAVCARHDVGTRGIIEKELKELRRKNII